MRFYFSVLGVVIALAVYIGITILEKKRKLEKKKTMDKNIFAQDFLNIHKIEGDILYSRDKKIYTYLRINPISIELYSYDEQIRMINNLTSSIKGVVNYPFKFISLPSPVDISLLIEQMKEQMKNANHIQRELIKREISFLSELAFSNEMEERRFYIVISEDVGNESELMKKAKELRETFDKEKIYTKILDKTEIIQFLNLFFNQNYVSFETSEFERTIPILE